MPHRTSARRLRFSVRSRSRAFAGVCGGAPGVRGVCAIPGAPLISAIMQFRGLICSNYPILRVAGCPELHDRRGSWKVRRECDDLPVLPAAVPGRRRRAAGRRRTQSLHDRRALRQPVPRRAAGSAARVGQRHPLKGEHTLLGLVEAPAAGKPWSTVAGLAYDVEGAMDGAIAESPPRALIQDLDTLPFPHVPTIRNSSSASGHCRCWPAVAVPDVARSARSTPSTGPHPARPSGSAPLRGWSRRCGCCTTSTACASSSSKTMTSRSGQGRRQVGRRAGASAARGRPGRAGLVEDQLRAEYVEPELFAPLASSGRSAGTVRRPPCSAGCSRTAGRRSASKLAREGLLRGNVMHPDYDFLGRRLNAYHQLLDAAAKHWIHNDGISHQLNWAWDEFFTARRLVPGLTGVPAYDRRCAGCLRGPARPTAATAQRLRAGQRRCAGRGGHGRRRARTGDGAAGALTLSAVRPGVC